MFRRKPAPDLIRGGYRFADKNMRQSRIPRACSDSEGTENALAARVVGPRAGGGGAAGGGRDCRQGREAAGTRRKAMAETSLRRLLARAVSRVVHRWAPAGRGDLFCHRLIVFYLEHPRCIFTVK